LPLRTVRMKLVVEIEGFHFFSWFVPLAWLISRQVDRTVCHRRALEEIELHNHYPALYAAGRNSLSRLDIATLSRLLADDSLQQLHSHQTCLLPSLPPHTPLRQEFSVCSPAIIDMERDRSRRTALHLSSPFPGRGCVESFAVRQLIRPPPGMYVKAKTACSLGE